MRRFLRKLYYILNNFKIWMRSRDFHVALSSEVKYPNLLNAPCTIGRNSYIAGSVGSYSYIGQNCKINANIGKFCSIGENVRVVESSHPMSFVSTSPVFYSPEGQCGTTFVNKYLYNDLLFADLVNKRSCIIGNDVWIGNNVLIKGGIKIGDGSCIAMGAVVTHDVEPYTVVGGVPAKVIKKRFSKNIIDKMIKISWWNKSVDWIKANKELFLDVDKFLEEVDK
jgi:acetyltransferase-like isoleucine patch superfamily enzyme